MNGRMARLPLRLEPEADESLVGFLVRLAERNGRDDVPAFIASLGVPFFSFEAAASNRFDTADLTAATLVPGDRLRFMAYWRTSPRQVSFRGHPLPRSLVSTARCRVCPACLRSSSHHRIQWDLAIATVCPDHGLALLDSCPGCGVALRWSSSSPGKCACGFELARYEGVRVESSAREGVAAVHHLLGVRSDHPARLPSKMMALGPEAAISLMLNLGWYAGGGTVPFRLRLRYAGLDFATYLQRGYATIADWPNGLATLLEQAPTHPPGTGRMGTRETLVPVVAWARRLSPASTLGAFLRRELTELAYRDDADVERTSATMPERARRAPPHRTNLSDRDEESEDRDKEDQLMEETCTADDFFDRADLTWFAVLMAARMAEGPRQDGGRKLASFVENVGKKPVHRAEGLGVLSPAILDEATSDVLAFVRAENGRCFAVLGTDWLRRVLDIRHPPVGMT